jgi:hypothetical protein
VGTHINLYTLSLSLSLSLSRARAHSLSPSLDTRASALSHTNTLEYRKVAPPQIATQNTALIQGWEDTVLWSPYGNEGMGYKNFACVESVKAQKPQKLAPGMSWMSSVDIIPGKPK